MFYHILQGRIISLKIAYFDLTSYTVENLSVTIRKNFKLKLKDFRRHVVYSFMYDGSQVCVAHISIFKELLGG